jgi:hypothetical protein
MGLNLPRHRAAVDNYFTSILSGKFSTFKDDSGAYFIDRDGQHFAPILTFLRTGKRNDAVGISLSEKPTKQTLIWETGASTVPQGTSIEAVIREAEFYCIQPLVDELRRKQEDMRLSRTDMTKAEFFHCLTMARIKGERFRVYRGMCACARNVAGGADVPRAGFMLSMSGMKMRGMDFSHMQLLNVHFSMCDLEVMQRRSSWLAGAIGG